MSRRAFKPWKASSYLMAWSMCHLLHCSCSSQRCYLQRVIASWPLNWFMAMFMVPCWRSKPMELTTCLFYEFPKIMYRISKSSSWQGVPFLLDLHSSCVSMYDPMYLSWLDLCTSHLWMAISMMCESCIIMLRQWPKIKHQLIMQVDIFRPDPW